MTKLLLGLLCTLLPLAAAADPAVDPGAAPAAASSLAPGGVLRAAINFGNPVLAQRDGAGGPPHGVSADLARELALRLGLPLRYVPYDGAGFTADAAKTGAWDICFLAIDPQRATGIAFTAPYVVIEGAYLVPQASPLHDVAEVDRDGVSITVDHGSAYDLFLQRTLHHAHLVYPPAGRRAGEYYPTHPTDVLAGVRQPLAHMVAENPAFRMIPGRFMEIDQAVGTLPGRDAGLAYLKAFVEDVKASGFVASSLQASGKGDAAVAPAAK